MEHPDAAALRKEVNRLVALNGVVGELIDQAMAKHVAINARSHAAAGRGRLEHLLGAASKSHRRFHRRKGRAQALEGRPHADTAIVIELVELAIREGERTKRDWERYHAALDEFLTAV